MFVFCSKTPLKRLQKTKSDIKTISAVPLKLLKEYRLCMSLHWGCDVTQSDLHETVFYSTTTHEGDYAEPPGAISPPAERHTVVWHREKHFTYCQRLPTGLRDETQTSCWTTLNTTDIHTHTHAHTHTHTHMLAFGFKVSLYFSLFVNREHTACLSGQLNVKPNWTAMMLVSLPPSFWWDRSCPNLQTSERETDKHTHTHTHTYTYSVCRVRQRNNVWFWLSDHIVYCASCCSWFCDSPYHYGQEHVNMYWLI